MKFNYEYRTSDNVQHKGVICASSREAAYDALRAKGIKPGRLFEAPGLLNKVLGKGKRWIAIVFFALLAAVTFFYAHETRQEVNALSYVDSNGFAVPIERRQIWGDSAVINQAASRNWRVIFPNPACRMLALFAQPGHTLGSLPRIPKGIEKDFEKALAEKERIDPDDLDEYKQMRCIIEGMKSEMREYMSAGGNLKGYVHRLQQRQQEEADYLKMAHKELMREISEGKDSMEAWQDWNRRLRTQGLPALPMPN